MRKFRILTSVACAAFVLSPILHLNAATYYVSASDPAATDSGPGTQAQPWKTIAKVNTASFISGDTICFKSGDTWRETLVPPKGGASSTARLTFTSYGAGNKPVISGADVVTGWTVYTDGTANTWQAPLAASTSMVTSDNSYIKRGGSKTTLAANQYRWEAGILYLNIGGDPSGHLIEAGQRNNAVYVSVPKNGTPKNYITLSGLSLQKTNLGNVSMTSVSYWIIENCDLFFGFNSGSAAGAGINSDRAHFAIYRGNHINYACGDGIMAWRSNDVEVSDNLIENVLDDGGDSGADCIQIGAEASTPNACANFKILNNVVSRASTSVSKGCIIAEMGNNGLISGNHCSKGRFGIAPSGNNVVVEYNHVDGFGNGGGIRITENLSLSGIKVRYNVISNSPGFTGIDITRDVVGQATPRSNFEILNNVIYNTYYGISIGQAFSGSICNNIVWSPSSSPRVRLALSSVIAGESLVIDHNIWQDQGAESMISFAGTPYYDLATWQTATGYDAHSTTSNPLWVNPAGLDFHLQSASPAIDAGANVGLTEDFEGNPVPQGAAPDIGAYEYGGLVSYEGFDYAAGTLSGANGGFGWSSGWTVSGGTGGNSVVSGGFSYTGLPAAGNRFQLYDTDGTLQQVSRTLGRTFGDVTETYWISFLAKKINSAREAYINFGGLGFRAYQGNDWQVKTPAASYATLTGAGYANLHLFLVRVDAGASGDTVRVWVDPVISAGEPAPSSALVTLNDAAGFSFNSVTIKHGPFGASSQSGEWDEIRLGTSFGSVTGGP